MAIHSNKKLRFLNAVITKYNKNTTNTITTSNSKINIYPNPNNGNFKLALKLGRSTNEKVNIQMINTMGKVCTFTKEEDELIVKILSEATGAISKSIREASVITNRSYSTIYSRYYDKYKYDLLLNNLKNKA
jgi:hypothetical protein